MRDDATLPILPSQRVVMLKTKNLNKLLSQNTSPQVTSAIIFTPSGSLIASSHAPSSAKTLRTQTTLAANIWCAYAATSLPAASSSSFNSDQQQQPANITSLTLELSTSNLHITQIRPRLLLCLIGPASLNPPPQQSQPQSQPPPKPPSSSSSGSVGNTTGSNNDISENPEPSTNEGPESPSGGSSMMAGQELDTASQQSGALGILRTQGEGLARWLEGELEGFSMPETM